jgi:hypothetical protein
MLARLDPALSEIGQTSQELTYDRTALAGLVQTAAQASAALDRSRNQLPTAIEHTAAVFTAIADQRQALADSLVQSPTVLAQLQRTLADANTSLHALRPTLRQVAVAAPTVDEFLARLTPTLATARPVVEELLAQLPGIRAGLAGLPHLSRTSIPALRALRLAMRVSRPILRGLRFYGSDLLLGVLNGLGVMAASSYGPTGRYGRLSYIQSPKTLIAGGFSNFFNRALSLPTLFNARTHVLRPCPGGDAPPAPDGSSPWIPDRSMCTPSDDIPASVNVP